MERFAEVCITIALLTSLDLHQSASVGEFFIIILSIPRKRKKRMQEDVKADWTHLTNEASSLPGFPSWDSWPESCLCYLLSSHWPILEVVVLLTVPGRVLDSAPPDLHRWEHCDPGRQWGLTLGRTCRSPVVGPRLNLSAPQGAVSCQILLSVTH